MTLFMKAPRLPLPWPPKPMCPVRIRSLAPKADAGTKYGTAKTAEAAAVVCKKRRRVKVTREVDMRCLSEGGRGEKNGAFSINARRAQSQFYRSNFDAVIRRWASAIA